MCSKGKKQRHDSLALTFARLQEDRDLLSSKMCSPWPEKAASRAQGVVKVKVSWHPYAEIQLRRRNFFFLYIFEELS